MMSVSMRDYENFFAGKKVTVMGLGLLGRGVGDAALIAEAGAAEVIVTDLKPEAELQASVEQLKQYESIKFVLGEHRLEDFTDRDIVLVAAGVPFDSQYVNKAKQSSKKVTQSAALFAEISKVPIIGVTGTRGKSTVTMMIHHCLEAITGEKILLGGNIRGVSNLQLLKEVKADSLCVMELDSWQLQGFGWAGISPQIAVFTNFMEDHLNYYTRDDSKADAMARYFKDKANIFLNQDESGTLVTTSEVFEWIKKVLPDYALGQEIVLTDSSLLPEEAHLAVPGAHNRLNAALAVSALKALSLQESVIYEALAIFGGVEGRLQFVKTVDNVRIYNDNNATTPQATTAALEALDLGNKNLILIAGGADKNIPIENLAYAINQHCKHVVLTPGSGTDTLLELVHAGPTSVSVVEHLSAAMTTAVDTAEAGDIILFSPAFASFSQYKNEYERNDEFMRLVEKL